jgi:hypothetical protein
MANLVKLGNKAYQPGVIEKDKTKGRACNVYAELVDVPNAAATLIGQVKWSHG